MYTFHCRLRAVFCFERFSCRIRPMTDATSKADIRALAQLTRLEISDAEVAKLETEIPGILSFVETIQQVETESKPISPEHRNIIRADSDPHESGMYTEELLSAAPAREGDKVAVKQVISRK